jgi:hypothetical protein
MWKWITPVYKSIRTRFRRFFGVRIADSISEQERDTCDRYGEQTISTMLAGGFTPITIDLQRIYQTEETRKRARDWLTETADVREFKDRWVSGRDLFLEIVVIALIGWEIGLGYQQEKMQSKNFNDQQKVLTSLWQSAKATADILASLKSTTEIMNEAVKRGTAATEANAATSAQTLHMSERAYLACAVSMPTPPKAGDKVHVVATITNAGKGLAIDVVTTTKLVSVSKAAPVETAYASVTALPGQTRSKQPLAAGQQIQQVLDSPRDLTDDDVAKVTDQEQVIYAFVDATYRDLFGRQHSTQMCAFYYPPTKQMAGCSTMNKAD